jgi:hypothetical protein
MSQADDETDMTAALLALGALTGADLASARRREREEPSLAARIAEWERALAPLALSLPPYAPPDGLMAQIDARLDARERFVRLAQTLREPEGEWIVIAAGLRCKVLERYPEQRRQMILLEAEPGALYPAHEHREMEELYVMSGDLVVGDDDQLRAGEFLVSQAGSRHPDLTTRTGCRCLICKEI